MVLFAVVSSVFAEIVKKLSIFDPLLLNYNSGRFATVFYGIAEICKYARLLYIIPVKILRKHPELLSGQKVDKRGTKGDGSWDKRDGSFVLFAFPRPSFLKFLTMFLTCF
jgi:hypothetical protein